MARKKVTLAWITNDSTRKATFKKRRRGLMKKVSELAALCDVAACAIIYGPGHAGGPEVWPSMEGSMEVLSRFKSLPEMEQCKKMMNQEGFIRLQAAKLREQLRKQERENRELHLSLLMHEGLNGRELHDVGIEDTTSLAWMIDMRMKAMQARIEQVKAQMAIEGGVKTKEKTSFDVALEELQSQNWLIDEYMAFGGQEMLQPCMENCSAWPEAFFPFNRT